MTPPRPWWTREAGDAVEAARRTTGPQPELTDATAAAIREQIRDRIAAATPEWTNFRRDDAGVALLRLLGGLFEPLAERVNRLPEKLLTEHLRIAGVRQLPASAAQVVVQIGVSDAATEAAQVAAGFQLGADPATGQGDRVVFETTRSLAASPLSVAEVHLQNRRVFTQVDTRGLDGTGGRVLPFGERPRPGLAMWLGLVVPFSPAPRLALEVVLAGGEGRPAAVARGGVAAPVALPPPVLRWEVQRAGGLEPVEVLLDETAALRQSGIVELSIPEDWPPEGPPGLSGDAELRWLRVQLVHGGFGDAPVIAGIHPNAMRAVAGRTVRGEVLEALGSPGDPRAQLRVSQVPVLPGSLVIEVDESGAGDVFGVTGPGQAAFTTWQEVASLADAGPCQRAFVLDPGSGVVTFGDGANGLRLPLGFRNVRAARYRVGGGPAGAIRAGTSLSPITSLRFVTGATNPAAASGGVDAEPVPATLRRGPLEVRSRGRAVTVSDYALLARQAPGADLARAYAAAGFHPEVRGAPIPGVVGVLVVPARRGDGPPLPDQGSLTAVATHLTARVAPAGVQVVVAAPRYELVRVEARIVTAGGADAGAVVSATLAAIDRYLDPVEGGEDGEGWPFGGAIRHAALLRRLLGTVPGLRAVPSLRLVVDGRRLPPCADHQTAAHALLWPAGHEVVPVDEEARR